jgi:GNAT superfamily N-acetyltransferase
MSLIIRSATIEDTSAILNFINQLAEYEKLAHEVIANESTLADSLFGEQPQAWVKIAEYEGKAAGFCLYFFNYSTFLAKRGIYLEDLFVLPEYRGKGIGKALLSALAKEGVDKNCGRVEWSVLDWNKPAIDFYHSINAQPMQGWTIFRLTGDALEQLGAQSNPQS